MNKKDRKKGRKPGKEERKKSRKKERKKERTKVGRNRCKIIWRKGGTKMQGKTTRKEEEIEIVETKKSKIKAALL